MEGKIGKHYLNFWKWANQWVITLFSAQASNQLNKTIESADDWYWTIWWKHKNQMGSIASALKQAIKGQGWDCRADTSVQSLPHIGPGWRGKKKKRPNCHAQEFNRFTWSNRKIVCTPQTGKSVGNGTRAQECWENPTRRNQKKGETLLTLLKTKQTSRKA